MQLSRYNDNIDKNEEEIESPGYLKLIFNNYPKKVNEELPVYEPFISLIVSFPFIQLTSVFFFCYCLWSY